MLTVQEFRNPADLVAHYKALNKRIFGVPKIPTTASAAPVQHDKPPVPPNTIVPKYYTRPVYKIPAIANLTTAQINELARRIAEHRAARGFGPVAYVSSAEQMTGIKVHDLIRLVETIAGVSAIDILSLRRDATSVKARQIVMWLAKKFTLRTFPEIGNYIGGRDHTTCLHGCNKVQRLINTKFGEPAGSSPEAWARHLWGHAWTDGAKRRQLSVDHFTIVPRPQPLSSGDPA